MLLLLAISLVFGTAVAALTPPLRGPDETMHVLRVVGLARGEFLAGTVAGMEHKSLVLPERLRAGFHFFERARTTERRGPYEARSVFGAYFRSDAFVPESPPAVAYEGGEGYSPVAYAGHLPGALAAELLGLDFLSTLYLIRASGLILNTVLLAWAVVLAPQLGWALSAMFLLPAALYGRSVVSADGATLAFAALAISLWLRFAASGAARRASGAVAAAMALAALAKPPNLSLVLLLGSQLRGGLRDTIAALLTAAPAALLAALWTALSSADLAAWRQVEITGAPLHEFDPRWKLSFLAGQPLHFFRQLSGSFGDPGELYRQTIGVLGLFDTVLRLWTYPLLGALLLATLLCSAPLTGGSRARVAAAAALTAVGYVLSVYVIFYLTWTPIAASAIDGVQGRYFVPALPLVAIIVVATKPWDRSAGAPYLATIFGILSGAACVDAILRSDWQLY